MGKDKWTKYWTTPYALTNCFMFGQQYTKSCWDELGIGFSEVNFIIEKRVATVFRIEKEQAAFNEKLGELFQQDTFQAKLIIKKAIKIQESLYDLFKAKSIYNHSFFNKFNKLYNGYSPYYLAIMWAANALDKEKDADLLKFLESARKATEKFYGFSEKFLNRYYSYIKKKTKSKESNVYTALTDEELATYLKSGILPREDLLRKRYKFSLVSSRKGKSEVYTGIKAKQIIKGKQLEEIKLKQVKSFKGQIAHKGRHQGIVRIVLNNREAGKLKKGEVLVTAMTRPEWISGIKKSGAIITEVGGVLCHAAIISRELKIPCVIGTKIATKVLKRGDMVEVDANRGIVKLKKRA